MQRQVSDSLDLNLPKFSLVDKQRRENSPTRLATAAQINRSNASSPRRQGIQISLPIESSVARDHDLGDQQPEASITTPKRNSVSSDHVYDSQTPQMDQNQDLLYKLAAKKRQIVELEQALNLARKELHVLETRYESVVSPKANPNSSLNNHENGNANSPMKPKNELMQNWSKRVQKTLDEVNNSPNVIKSKQSISSFFNGEVNAPNTQERANESTRPSFFQNILDKFNEFSVAEEEEEEFDRTQNSQIDQFYLKDKLDYDDEEEIPNEETGHTLLNDKKTSRKFI